MKGKRSIPINRFQLHTLLNEQMKEGFRVIVDMSIYCSTCGGAAKGVHITELFLEPQNDVLVHGTCSVCTGAVSRLIEYGDDAGFREQAEKFRRAIE